MQILCENLRAALRKLPAPRPTAQPYLTNLLSLCEDYEQETMTPQESREAFLRLWDEYLRFKSLQPPAFEQGALYKDIEDVFDNMYAGRNEHEQFHPAKTNGSR